MNFDSMQILLFLLPGLLSSVIMESLIIRKEKNQFYVIIEALILSIIIYLLFLTIKNGFIFVENLIFNKSIQFQTDILKLKIEYTDMILLIIISLISGFFLGIGIYKDWFLKPLRKIGLTKKTTRESVWHDVFFDNNKNRPVIIYFMNGNRLSGLVKHFSDSDENPYLYLVSPAWVVYNKKSKKNEYRPFDGTSGILITPEDKIKFIEFRK